MQNKTRKNTFPEIKFFVTTLSITAIVAFWNLFAKQALESNNPANANLEPGSEAFAQNAHQFTLPTLVPFAAPQQQEQANDPNATPISISELQKVTAPTQPSGGAAVPFVVDTINLNQSAQPQAQAKDPAGQTQAQPQAQPTVAATTSSSK